MPRRAHRYAGAVETLSDKLAVVEAAFRGIAAGDADAMLADYADDVVLELPYGDPPGKRIEGKEEVRRYLRAAFEVFRFELRILEVHELADPEMLVLEYESAGRMLTTGAPYANRYIGVYRFVDGRVVSVREFYDPSRVTR
jgi:uncharacterized protein